MGNCLLAADYWASSLALWGEVGEAHYSLCRAALASPGARPPDWPTLAEDLCRRGMASLLEPGSLPPRLVFAEAARMVLLGDLAAAGKEESTKRALVRAWPQSPAPACAAAIITWARELEMWSELALIWVQASRRLGYSGVRDVIPLFSGLPDEVRQSHPLLSVASAIAGAEASPNSFGHPWAGREIVRDAVLFHSQWKSHSSDDQAIVAGTLWMLVQRQLPGTREETGLSKASAIKAAILERIELASSAAEMPSEYAIQLFHVGSAETSLAVDDPALAASEADLATLLGDGPLQILASGLSTVARELLGQPPARGAADRSDWVYLPDLEVATTSPIVFAHALAAGLRGLAELDQGEVWRALSLVPDRPQIGAPYWILRAWIDALHGALWGDPETSLATLDWVQGSVGITEWREPLARRLLTGARIHLLTQLGARNHAEAAISSLPTQDQWTHRARALLWSGDVRDATYVASAGIYDPKTPLADRQDLLTVKAASLVMDPDSDPKLRSAAILASARSTTLALNYLPLGLLPTDAAIELLKHFRATESHSSVPRLVDRVADRFDTLSNHTGYGPRTVRLSNRELVLLPLLATSATVPEIAHQLGVSVHTVRKQVATLRSKFGVASRAELVRLAGHSHPPMPTSATRASSA